MPKTAPSTVPFYRNARVLPLLWQGAVLLVVVAGAALLLMNFKRGLEAQGLDPSFAFLGRPAGFHIAEGLAFDPSETYLKAFGVGLFNTFRATAVGILLASILGVVAGVGRLSSNWLVNRLAFSYVELIRNTPLYVQLAFWYFAVVLQFPDVRDAIRIGPTIFLSQRGLVLPWLEAPGAFWGVAFGGPVLALLLWRVLARLQRRSGRSPFVGWAALGLAAASVPTAWLLFRSSLAVSVPAPSTFGIRGGLTLSPEFTALLAALVVYFGAFIAEVIRGGITAVPKGQWEAARALGLGYLETLRIIVLPQAMRIIVPPLGNIYLNLTKASSLGVAIGYPDLFGVAQTISPQSGYAVPVMLIVLIVYPVITLTIATGVNALDRSVQVRAR